MYNKSSEFKFNKPLATYLISIVTPMYNSECYIRETVKSIQQQSYEFWELFLIDDCSTDSSLEIAKQLSMEDPRIKVLINKRNSGPAISRNKAIDSAKGDFLAFLDADDLWHPSFLETSLKRCIKEGYKFTFTSYNRVDENLQPVLKDFIVPEKVTYESLLKTCPILLSSSFIDVKSLGKEYMPILDKRQDWGFFLAVLKKEKYAYGIKKPLVLYRIRRDSISRNKRKLLPYVWKIYREVEGFGVLRSGYYFVHWALNGFKKYYVKK